MHETEQFYSKTSAFLLLWLKRNTKRPQYVLHAILVRGRITALPCSIVALYPRKPQRRLSMLFTPLYKMGGTNWLVCPGREFLSNFRSTIRVKKCYQDNRTLERYTHTIIYLYLIESKATALLVSPEQDRCQGFPDAAYRRTHPR